MRSRSLAAQHDAAVARRLELLTTELAAARDHGRAAEPPPRQVASGSPHGHTRIRPVPDLDVDEAVAGPDDPHEAEGRRPMTARMPGRHASRRGPVSWCLGLPEAVRGRVALGPGQLTVVAVLAVVGLVLTCWWLVRSAGHEVMAPAALTTPIAALATPVTGEPGQQGADPQGTEPGTTPPGAARARVVVDVTGKVRRPGIAVLRQGARVVDALRAAGGARPGVDLGGLNLARVLTDGEQVVVGQVGVAGPVTAASGSTSPVTGLVNINTADQTTLESLPDVGPVTAQAILTWRSQHGGFASVDQLLDVDGIGDATLAKLTPYVTI
ncbi:MAG TPA: ComEA family DNA-binding protein [Nocardioides sp.]|jgi:competence protein ComEA|nr:ComEA family DNA-binding protein [Nocardioides sp.]